MSDLKQADIQELMRYIRKQTKKGPGYVGDFNDLTFREFVNGATGYNIDDKKYKTNETSKEERLRDFLTIVNLKRF